ERRDEQPREEQPRRRSAHTVNLHGRRPCGSGGGGARPPGGGNTCETRVIGRAIPVARRFAPWLDGGGGAGAGRRSDHGGHRCLPWTKRTATSSRSRSSA